jgi:hypothetical protein
MRSFSSARTIRFLLAPLLSLWVAGAGCMLGCESMVAYGASGGGAESTHHPDQTATIVASGHSCASGETNKSHDCCKKSAAKVKPHAPTNGDASILRFGGSSSSTMNGCPLAVDRAAIIAKTHSGDLSAAPAHAQSILPDLNSLERTAPLSPPLRLPNRGHTYLHCCVFLI